MKTRMPPVIVLFLNGLLAVTLAACVGSGPGGATRSPQHPATIQEPHSGVILDLRAEVYRPALKPKVIGRDGRLVYNAAKVDYRVAVLRGHVEYGHVLSALRRHPRLGGNPWLIRPFDVDRKNRIIMGYLDATRLRLDKKLNAYLRAGRLGILLPEPPPDGHFTGLIVDMRGQGFRPHQYLKLRTTTGRVIHDIISTDRKIALRSGVTGFTDRISQAFATARAGRFPLIIKATKSKHLREIIVSERDAARIAANPALGRALHQARAIVVIGD